MANKISVTNRSTGLVCYMIPETNQLRQFNPKETKIITDEEIAAVCMQPGGRELFYNYLFINSEETLTSALNVNPEPEYWLQESQIPSWVNSCSVDEFSDALNYAPEGIKDLIKSYCVSVPVTDMNKRVLVKEILGFDVTAAIEAAKPDNEAEATAATSSTKIQTGRKTTPNYKIVQPKTEA